MLRHFPSRALKAARAAWNWCQSNPNVFFKNPADIHTAEFADTDCHDELLWAAAGVMAYTGDTAFHQAFMGMLPQPLSKIKIDVPSPMQVSSLDIGAMRWPAEKVRKRRSRRSSKLP